jgi:hypothetical protein
MRNQGCRLFVVVNKGSQLGQGRCNSQARSSIYLSYLPLPQPWRMIEIPISSFCSHKAPMQARYTLARSSRLDRRAGPSLGACDRAELAEACFALLS